ncbi:hypothetical protein L288_02230 [Sphingobium quisquiliarum P25]|uniref:Uncharacterized protein n=1 Tax=Sphingobium quisquiliarum P25 TaxID=1329909 RepID=T0IPR7_9SPHN|nr:hypothetical protein [Sphingobium quisquiliarum]EQB13795.1 hypothetical protein L288_02230 [Sphingobium quisquiliarum P25]
MADKLTRQAAELRLILEQFRLWKSTLSSIDTAKPTGDRNMLDPGRVAMKSTDAGRPPDLLPCHSGPA